MAVYEQTDGLIPNLQTPPATSVLGSTTNPFTQVNATTVSGTTVGATTNLYVAGARVARIYSATVDFVGGTALTVTHSLGSSNPIVQVYGSGLNQQLPFGSGTVDAALPAPQSIITSISGISANAVGITVTSGVAGATVVVFG